MNEQTRAYVDKVAKIIAANPDVTKAVVVGPAVEKGFTFGDKIQLAVLLSLMPNTLRFLKILTMRFLILTLQRWSLI